MTATRLSLADHVCLALIAERPTHGWAVVRLLRADGEIGRIWSLSRPLTYRAIGVLADTGHVERTESGRRTMLSVTPVGQQVNTAWLDEPVDHLRDLRTEFLLKIELRLRAGLRLDGLVERQRVRLAPAIVALTTIAPDDPVGLWRQESAAAAERFLDRISDHLASPP